MVNIGPLALVLLSKLHQVSLSKEVTSMNRPVNIPVSRRGFLKAAGSATGAALALLGVLDAEPERVGAALVSAPQPTTTITSLAAADGGPEPDALIRMQSDLKRALQKPVQERRWVMVIDLRKCVGCHACTIACVAENKLPPGVVYRPVLENEIGTYPNVTRRFIPKPCMQCDNPPCVPVCPVNATYKNDDGVVVIDYDQCIGCRYCVTACPYASRTFDFGQTYTKGTPVADGLIVGQNSADDYERASNFEYGEAWARQGEASPIGNVRKCHFCLHRLKEGMLPACTTTCIGRATYFGDANDSESLVSELIASPNLMRLKEELGTEPRVYYLV
jgi:molybdopterin-containing oxidoreductase family iron-sulfur binding subunit